MKWLVCSKLTLANNELEFLKSKTGEWTIHTKQYLKGEDGQVRMAKPFSVIDNVYSQHGTNEIIDIFGNAQIFPYPKPTGLLSQVLDVGLHGERDCIVLDFFAGSCGLAETILRKNQVDRESNLRYIMVQLPEICESSTAAAEAGFRTIAEIGKQRIRAASKETSTRALEHNQELLAEMFSAEVSENVSSVQLDRGFKLFQLIPSHYKKWQNYDGTDPSQLETLFSQFESPLVEGWQPQNLLTEILLMEGFPLDSHIEKRSVGSGAAANTLHAVSSDFCEHKLLVCLDEKIGEATIQELQLGENDIFICLDSAIGDEDKVRLSDKGLLKTI